MEVGEVGQRDHVGEGPLKVSPGLEDVDVEPKCTDACVRHDDEVVVECSSNENMTMSFSCQTPAFIERDKDGESDCESDRD